MKLLLKVKLHLLVSPSTKVFLIYGLTIIGNFLFCFLTNQILFVMCQRKLKKDRKTCPVNLQNIYQTMNFQFKML
jgi:hypothetical protein